MRRIMVMGPPGSGKSTLARHLGVRHGVKVFHLDQAYWQPGWVETDSAAFRAAVEAMAAQPGWVIDGNYTDTIAPRLAAADTLVYLDLPAWRTLPRILIRTALSYGRVRADAAEGCAERLDFAFLQFAWSWNRIRRSRNLAIAAGFGGRTVILRGRAAVQTFMRE
jgi:adenylate kinase family enzyme